MSTPEQGNAFEKGIQSYQRLGFAAMLNKYRSVLVIQQHIAKEQRIAEMDDVAGQKS